MEQAALILTLVWHQGHRILRKGKGREGFFSKNPLRSPVIKSLVFSCRCMIIQKFLTDIVDSFQVIPTRGSQDWDKSGSGVCDTGTFIEI